jgi:hypothetical protein
LTDVSEICAASIFEIENKAKEHVTTFSLLLAVRSSETSVNLDEKCFVPGGCSAFGHSCFGGHGKRADVGSLPLPGADSDQQQRLVFPEAETGFVDGEEASIQPEGYGALSPASSESLVPSPNRLSPFLRQWASIASACRFALLDPAFCSL